MSARPVAPLLFALVAACQIDATIAAVPHDAASESAHVCPPEMANLGAYCIDLTEVTVKAYQDWIATGPAVVGQPPECAWNTSYGPERGTAGTGECNAAAHPEINADPSRPVVCVDWCDAYAYCAAAGKHLCGRIGGGSDGGLGEEGSTVDDPDRSEWFHACIGPTRTKYPYGDTYVKGTCSDDATATTPQPVGASPACHAPAGTAWGAIVDMSGNAIEWTDSCQRSDPSVRPTSADICVQRGGWYKDAPAALSCAAASTALPRARNNVDNHMGFRCCK
jgi:formylglycine-generating enzyme required for sulfatase activity